MHEKEIEKELSIFLKKAGFSPGHPFEKMTTRSYNTNLLNVCQMVASVRQRSAVESLKRSKDIRNIWIFIVLSEIIRFLLT